MLDVWYSTEKHQEKLSQSYNSKNIIQKIFTPPKKMLVYLDKGKLDIDKRGIKFEGEEINKKISWNSIKKIDRYQGFSVFDRYKINWVRISHENMNNQEDTLFCKGSIHSMKKLIFGKGSIHSMKKYKKDTDKLYEKIKNRIKNKR